MAQYPVYSTQFILYTPETPNPEYLVPEGYLAVVRQVLCSQNVGGYILQLQVADNPDAPLAVIWTGAADGVANSVAQEMRVVVPWPGLISVNLSEIGSGVGIYVGGYLLRLP
jgi:hypothetical protein